MKKLTIVISYLFILPFAFAYDLSCHATRYMGFKNYKLSIYNVDTSFKSRNASLELMDFNGKSIVESKVVITADYLEEDSLLTIESRDLDIYGYINMSFEEGSIDINSKSYEIVSCELTK